MSAATIVTKATRVVMEKHIRALQLLIIVQIVGRIQKKATERLVQLFPVVDVRANNVAVKNVCQIFGRCTIFLDCVRHL
jgi:hypothetical protein